MGRYLLLVAVVVALDLGGLTDGQLGTSSPKEISRIFQCNTRQYSK